jgi:hypothetical protein
MNRAVFLVLILIGSSISACSQPGDPILSQGFAPGKTLAENTQAELKEVSGIASSHNNPGMLWVHNDHGNNAEVYLLNRKLDIVLTCRLEGIDNRDWEDMVIGPGPVAGINYIYVGDIGDNDATHEVKYIYRFPEPVYKPGEKDVTVSDVEKITFRLSDGMNDCESLMIDHKTKTLYVISKDGDEVPVYELQWTSNQTGTVVAKKIMTLPYSRIVSADCDYKTGDILIKNYDKVFYWQNNKNESISSLLKHQPVEVPYEKETQGEAITWATDGSGFYTMSERKKKGRSWLYFYENVKKQSNTR